VYTGYKLVVFKRWGDEMKQLPNFLLCFGAAVVELAVENFFVWCGVYNSVVTSSVARHLSVSNTVLGVATLL
jgi:hypothetical protein